MFGGKTTSKIKNEKITRWRIELSNYSYDIIYRPGKKNLAADAFSRISTLTQDSQELKRLHAHLCHPGVTRFFHWVRAKNLPFTLEDVKRICQKCEVCLHLKPKFHKFEGQLIKATSPFERLNIDFKGPLPSTNRNKYLLVVIDEFSRFPFAFPCSDLSSSTVITHLSHLFMTFGIPAYIHSDRGSSFLSSDVKAFLTKQGIATSRTTPYNPRGNGQVERYNGIIWKTISLALKQKCLGVAHWQAVLDEALHSVRSLLCTSTNQTPHERFFSYPRRSSTGVSLPDWLTHPGPVLLRKCNRASKYEPLVEEVYLLEANPSYAHIRSRDGKESTVSLRHLAPGVPHSTQPPTPIDSPPAPEVPQHLVPPMDFELQNSNNHDEPLNPERALQQPPHAEEEEGGRPADAEEVRPGRRSPRTSPPPD